MTKYVHDNHVHVYYLNEGIYGTTLKQYSKDDGVPASKITLDADAVVKFKEMLAKGGWYESTAGQNT